MASEWFVHNFPWISSVINFKKQGCTVTQRNKELAVGLALAANTQTSSLSAIVVRELLLSPKLPALLTLNSERLGNAYWMITNFFKQQGIPYYPCNAGIFIFAKLAPDADTWEDEELVVGRLREAGVSVSSGRNYHGPESAKGWMRVGFAVEIEQLIEALQRMEKVLRKPHCAVENGDPELQMKCKWETVD